MAEYPLFAQANGTVNAQGKATLSLGPQYAREQWNVDYTTVTSLNATSITVSQFGNVVDSTANDPRPTVTDDTKFNLKAGNTLTVTWAGLPNGTPVQVVLTGTRTVGGA